MQQATNYEHWRKWMKQKEQKRWASQHEIWEAFCISLPFKEKCGTERQKPRNSDNAIES